MNCSPIKPSIYKRAASYIEKSKTTQKILRFADSNPSLFNSGTVFFLATCLRPSAIIGIPSKSKDGQRDNVYSASRSIATGFVDIGFSLVAFVPLNKIIDGATRKLFNTKNTVYFQNKESCSAWKSIANRGAKIALLPLIAYLNFKYVRLIADKISGRSNKQK